MLFNSYQYQCINKHVTNPCSATVLPLLTAIVYKFCQCEAPISGYDDVPEYLKYLICKNCIFCRRIELKYTNQKSVYFVKEESILLIYLLFTVYVYSCFNGNILF